MRRSGPKQSQIDTLAKRWADRRYGGPVDSRPITQAIAAYMHNWPTQHGSLPNGEHKVKVLEKGMGPTQWPEGLTFDVDFDRLQSDPNYPEGIMWEYRRRLLYTLRPGDRVVFDSYLPEDRIRYGLKGTVVESSGFTHGWAVVELDNGEKGLRVDGGTKLKKLGKPQS